MVARQLAEVAAGDFGVDVRRGVDIVIRFKALGERDEDLGEHFRVVSRAVVVELAETEVIRHGVQLDILDIRQDRTRDRHGVDRGVRVIHAHVLTRLADEGGVKGRVVRYQDIAAGKFQKSGDRFALGRRVLDHGVGDAGQLGDLGRDRHFGIREGREGVDDLAVHDLDCADLRDLVL